MDWTVVAPVATLVGAILGVLGTYYFNRAKPLVLVDSIQISDDFPDESSGVEVDEELLERFVQYGPLISNLGERRTQVTEPKYVELLKQGKEQLENYLNVFYPQTEKYLGKLRDYVSAENYTAFEDELAKHAPSFFMQVAVAISHEAYVLRNDEGRYEGQTAYRRFEVEENGRGALVALAGPRVIALVIRQEINQLMKGVVTSAGVAVAEMVAYRDKEELVRLIEFLQSDSMARRDAMTVTLQQVGEALRPYSRICLQGVLGNTGRTPVSFSNRGNMVVRIKGHVLSDGKIEEDLDLPVRLGQQKDVIFSEEGHAFRILDNTNPFLVPAGGSVRFVAVTEQNFQALTHASTIRALFGGGDRRAYLTLQTISRRSRTGVLHSSDVLFRDLQVAASFKRKKSWCFEIQWK